MVLFLQSGRGSLMEIEKAPDTRSAFSLAVDLVNFKSDDRKSQSCHSSGEQYATERSIP
ncbi:hypothetical protein NPIL_52151, partial [Nephila pilipes]